jgi:hypothetical protein
MARSGHDYNLDEQLGAVTRTAIADRPIEEEQPRQTGRGGRSGAGISR